MFCSGNLFPLEFYPESEMKGCHICFLKTNNKFCENGRWKCIAKDEETRTVEYRCNYLFMSDMEVAATTG